MKILLALVIGALFAGGLYMVMRRSLVKLAIGLALIGYAINLLIFTAGGLVRAAPPLIPPDAERVAGPVADPLPQALILTAIVIGFGVQAFTLVLAKRVYRAVGTDDLDAIGSAHPSGVTSQEVTR